MKVKIYASGRILSSVCRQEILKSATMAATGATPQPVLPDLLCQLH